MPHSITRVEFDVLDSTSVYARRIVEEGGLGDGPVVVVARTQTGGIGRLGRAWSSPAGGLWFTMIWPPSRSAAACVEGLGVRIGVALTERLRQLIGRSDAQRVQLKWPNDVLIDDRKFCGVLTEVVGGGAAARVLIGVGINANFDPHELPESLHHRATTLRAALGRTLDTSAMMDELVPYLGAAVEGPWPDPSLVNRANELLWGVGERHLAVMEDSTTRMGTLVGLDERGVPVVKTAAGEGRLPTTAL